MIDPPGDTACHLARVSGNDKRRQFQIQSQIHFLMNLSDEPLESRMREEEEGGRETNP